VVLHRGRVRGAYLHDISILQAHLKSVRRLPVRRPVPPRLQLEHILARARIEF
jgi:hypothetical protein